MCSGVLPFSYGRCIAARGKREAELATPSFLINSSPRTEARGLLIISGVVARLSLFSLLLDIFLTFIVRRWHAIVTIFRVDK